MKVSDGEYKENLCRRIRTYLQQNESMSLQPPSLIILIIFAMTTFVISIFVIVKVAIWIDSSMIISGSNINVGQPFLPAVVSAVMLIIITLAIAISMALLFSNEAP
jgi:hypothetical protein